MEKEVNLFYKDEEDIKKDVEIIRAVKKEAKSKEETPLGYIPVKLPSKGKLGYPDVLHIRNFLTEEIASFSLEQDEKVLDALLPIVKHIIWEDIDASALHLDDLKVILLYLINNFWDGKIEIAYPFTVGEMEELETSNPERAKSIKAGRDPKVMILISQIEVKDIPEVFQEPFTVSKNGVEIAFRLPRIGDILLVRNFVKAKYKDDDVKYADLYKKLNKDETLLTEEEKEILLAMEKRKGLDFMQLLKAITVVSFNGKQMESLEEALALHIDHTFWLKYKEHTEEAMAFGVVEDIEVKSPLTSKPEIRRFNFRADILLENLRLPEVDGFTISYGK